MTTRPLLSDNLVNEAVTTVELNSNQQHQLQQDMRVLNTSYTRRSNNLTEDESAITS